MLLIVSIFYYIIEALINVSSVALVLCSLFWLFFIISEIRRIYPLWKYQLNVSSIDGDDRAKYYKNILIKNVLSLLFVLSELITFSAETLECVSHLLALQLGYSNATMECPFKNQSYLWWNSEVPAVGILETIRQIGMLFLSTTLTVLVLHLQYIYTGFNRVPLMKRHINITCVCALIIIITKSFMSTTLISEIIYILTLPILTYFLIKQTRYLYASVRYKLIDLWYEGEFYQAMYMREKRLLNIFKWTIVPIYVSAVIGIGGQVFYGIVYVLIGSVVENSCWFNTQYNTQLNFSNSTLQATEHLVEISKFVFLATGSLFTSSVVVVNFGIYMSVLAEKFKGGYFGRASLKTLLIH